MTDIATLHTDALELQAVLSEVTTQVARGYGNIAAGKLNRVGEGLSALVAGLAELDVEEDPEFEAEVDAALDATEAAATEAAATKTKAKAGKRKRFFD